jgi:hypothetical protein
MTTPTTLETDYPETRGLSWFQDGPAAIYGPDIPDDDPAAALEDPPVDSHSGDDAPEGDELGHEFRIVLEPSEMEEALAVANGPRSELYGDPREHWTATGRGWAGLISMRLGVDVPDLPPDLVCLMFDYDKSIRLCKTPTHRDSRVDKHGYLHHHGDVAG